MKSFNVFLTESEPIKPVQPAERIPKKLPPSKKPVKKPQPVKKTGETPPERAPDRFEPSEKPGFKPYTRRGL